MAEIRVGVAASQMPKLCLLRPPRFHLRLRQHVGLHPALGAMTSFQILLLNGAHGKRQALEIEEMKTDKGYPKS